MRKLLFTAALALCCTSYGSRSAFAADSLKVAVGHMCCGACKAAATAGVKTLAWADTVAIDAATVTVTAKADAKVDVVSLMDALSKCGFPAREITVSGPVTLTLAHLCCAGCTNDLKAKIGEFRSEVLDKAAITVDQAAKTVTLQPVAGKSMNLVAILNQMSRAGFSMSKGSVTVAAAPAAKTKVIAAK